jgi:LPXTG-motif cell wall-anchored protein
MDEEYAISLLESSKDLTWTVTGDNQITAEFTLHADESITIDCIPLGAVYTVEEVLTEESRTAFSVSAEVTAGDGEAAGAIVSGSIAEENAVLYTNAFFEIVETTVPATTVPETTVPRDVTNPSTGDSGMDMMIFALLLSAAATMILLQKRRFL